MTALLAQVGAQPRRIPFVTLEPIVKRIQPGDQRILIVSPLPERDLAHPEEGTFVATIVKENPIIFTGRIVEKQPAFLYLRGRQNYREVSIAEANWIGSRITVMVDRILQTVDELPLTILHRLTFIEDGDGTAMINGVRVDTETPWLDPLQQGRRYLISGRLKAGAFSPTGMWMEPADGGNLRPRLREFWAFTSLEKPPVRTPRTPFDDWTINEASDSLEVEVQRQRNTR